MGPRPDNLKAAVIRVAFSPSDPTALQRSYREMAQHYGFTVDPTPPRDPQKKGKVEARIKYVKRAFFRGREGQRIDEVDAAFQRWLRDVANVRIHGTTRERPEEAFARDEQHLLGPLPARPFELLEWRQAKVHRDAHVAFDKRLYSVPWQLVGREVWVRATTATVMVFADESRVATHARRGAGPRSTFDAHLPAGRRAYRYRDRRHREREAEAMGPHVLALVQSILDADDVLYAVRPVQAVMQLFSTLPAERIERVCARASFYGMTSYGAIKRMVRDGLDFEPLPTVSTPSYGPLASPRLPRTAVSA